MTTDADTQTRGPIGAQIPRAGLESAEELARKLWDLSRGSAVEKGAFGKHIGNKETSGPFATKLALLRYFSLVEDVDGKIQLSTIGRDIVRDDAPAKREAARQQAFRGVPNYQSLLDRFVDHGLPTVDSLATTLHYEFSLKEDAANKAASAFIESAKLADLADEAGAVNVGEPSPAEQPEETEQPEEIGGVNGQREESAPQTATSSAPPVHPLEQRVVSSAAHVSVSVSLDLSAFDVDEVLRILAAIGAVPNATAEQ